MSSGESLVPVPDEAQRAALKASAEFDIPVIAMVTGVEAAAPLIARAARIAALREVAGELGRRADASRHDEREVGESYVWEMAHSFVRDELIVPLLEADDD